MQPLLDGTRSITLSKAFKSSKLPFGGEKTSSPGPASPCSPRVPSSRARPGKPGRPSQERLPGNTLSRPRGRARFIERAGSGGVWLSRRSSSSAARTGSRPANPPGVRFSLSQQAGKACTARPAQRGQPAWLHPASPKPELPATCSTRRGGGVGRRAPASCPGGRPCEFLRKKPSGKHQNLSKDVALPLLLFCGLPSCLSPPRHPAGPSPATLPRA